MIKSFVISILIYSTLVAIGFLESWYLAGLLWLLFTLHNWEEKS